MTLGDAGLETKVETERGPSKSHLFVRRCLPQLKTPPATAATPSTAVTAATGVPTVASAHWRFRSAATSVSATLAMPDGPPAAAVGPCLACSQLQPVIGVGHREPRTRGFDVSRHG